MSTGERRISEPSTSIDLVVAMLNCFTWRACQVPREASKAVSPHNAEVTMEDGVPEMAGFGNR